jgi:hypothetical protein
MKFVDFFVIRSFTVLPNVKCLFGAANFPSSSPLLLRVSGTRKQTETLNSERKFGLCHYGTVVIQTWRGREKLFTGTDFVSSKE